MIQQYYLLCGQIKGVSTYFSIFTEIPRTFLISSLSKKLPEAFWVA